MRTVKFVADFRAGDSGLKTYLLTLFTAFLLTGGLLVASPALAVHDTASADNIELEGDSVNSGGAVEGLDDWDDVYADCGLAGPCAPVTTLAMRQAMVDDSAATDNSIFSGGLKDTLPISDWTCDSGGASPSKNNIITAYSATYVDDGEVFIYTGADRETIEGTANFGVWLFQEAVGCESAGGTTSFTGQHLDGDVLLIAEFDQGGSVSEMNVYRWTDPDGIPENGDECLGGNGPGSDEGLCTLEGGTFLTGLNCNASSDDDLVCGVTNDTALLTTAWRTDIGINGFYESGANLTQLVGEVGCFANVMVETRTSTSLTAAIKDFVFLNMPTCALDSDLDGIEDYIDNCPGAANPLQEDFDDDGLGYFCDLTCATGMDFVHAFNESDIFDLQASGSISYGGTIASGADISFDAGQGVVLKNGTSIGLGGVFTIMTTGCVP